MNAANSNPNQAGGGAPFSLDQLLTGSGGLATGAAAGGLAALLLGGAKPKKLAKNALKVGGVALVGGLAYKAYQDWQKNKAAVSGAPAAAAPPAPPEEALFIPQASDQQARLAQSLMRAMASAAKADGHVTPEEQNRILQQLQSIEMRPEDFAFIKAELESPLDMEAVVRDATTPELAAELYAASLLVVDPDGLAEKAYLSQLASKLHLQPELVEHIHANASA